MVKERLRQLLARREKQRIVDASRVPSAVLVPIYRREGQYYILLTKRTENVDTHKGQISFPGGAYEAVDKTLLDTALRESAEEIGLLAKDVEGLGELSDECSVASHYVIAPFVGFIPWPYQFTLNQVETDRLIEVPVAALLEKGCRHQGTEISAGKGITGYFYLYNGDVIWGATARILGQLLDIMAQAVREDPNCMT